MNMDTSRNVVKRHQFADYLNTQSADKPNYCLMGVGFTSLNEEPGAQTESKKYVNENGNVTVHNHTFSILLCIISRYFPGKCWPPDTLKPLCQMLRLYFRNLRR